MDRLTNISKTETLPQDFLMLELLENSDEIFPM